MRMIAVGVSACRPDSPTVTASGMAGMVARLSGVVRSQVTGKCRAHDAHECETKVNKNGLSAALHPCSLKSSGFGGDMQ
jgi:hypothetical protein